MSLLGNYVSKTKKDCTQYYCTVLICNGRLVKLRTRGVLLYDSIIHAQQSSTGYKSAVVSSQLQSKEGDASYRGDG